MYSIGDRILTKYDQYSKQEIMNYIDSIVFFFFADMLKFD